MRAALFIRTSRRKIICVEVLMCILFFGIDQNSFSSSGASFLKLGVGARALGLSSAYTAIANDVTSLYWNPAGLSNLRKKELSAMHAELFADSKYDFFGYAHHTVRGTFGFGVVYLSQGAIEGRSQDRNQTSDFTASDLAMTLGASKFFIDNVSLGMNLKLIQSRIAGFSSTGFAFDMGTIWKIPNKKIQSGLTIQNIGPKMQFIDEGYNLPLTIASGVGYQLISQVLISADLKYHPYDSRTMLSIGAEFSTVSMLFLRTGYITNSVGSNSPSINNKDFSEKASNLSGLGFGLGLKLGSSTVDYSFTPAGALGNTQRISLSVK